MFVTEATFGLPVFTHPPAAGEMRKLLDSVATFPERTHVVGAYALGKTQRLIAELRALGFDDAIYLHGALLPVCAVYERMGVGLGELRPATLTQKSELAGENRAGTAVRHRRSLGAAADRPGHRHGQRLDAGAPARQGRGASNCR